MNERDVDWMGRENVKINWYEMKKNWEGLRMRVVWINFIKFYLISSTNLLSPSLQINVKLKEN